MTVTRSVFPLVVVLLLSAGMVRTAAAEGTKTIDFNRDIRPILSDVCFQCHGPDEKARKADLRLDLPQEILADRGGYAAVVPGKPGESELLKRIASTDPDEKMPPAGFVKSLTPAQIGLFRRWIAEGAEWQGHWAYQPVAEVPPPEIADGRVANEIDRFVLAKLKEKQLRQSPRADKVTLVRRVYHDLIGLPPTPAQVRRFVENESPNAYAELVDELLASPQFGERMAMYWLDLVRYADTNGIHGDNHREHWLYRDYVIQAFNRNKPFDEFTIEQIAGDLLAEPTRETRIASGYNRLLLTTQEGGAQAKEYIAKYSADRVRNLSSAWLGSTMMCCECHDHKYDPFSTKDFYSLAAFFADIQEVAVGAQPATKMPTEEETRRLAEFDARIAELKQQLVTLTPELTAGLRVWEAETLASLKDGKLDWYTIAPKTVSAAAGTQFDVQNDAAVLTKGPNPAKETYTISFETGLDHLTGLRLEALTHPSFGNQSLSRANGNFVLTGIEVSVQRKADEAPRPVKIASARSDLSQSGFPIEHAFDDNAETGWAVEGWQRKENRAAVFVFAEPVAAGSETKLTVVLKHESPHAGHNIGKFRLSLTQVEKPELTEQGGLSATIVEILKLAPDARSAEQTKTLETHFLQSTALLDPVRKELAGVEKARQQFEAAIPELLITSAGAPRMVRILPRGNWLDDNGEVVEPAVPAFLPGLSDRDGRASRLDLAKWLVSRDNPLTARVFVNRLWKLAFGRGLVDSLDDFGSQALPPTHPELLDWLAADFVDNGWDVKRSLRLILLSETYQQSSHADAQLRTADPFNEWLARQGRFRVDAETVRDNALAVSGLLVAEIGGPSVKPYQPAGYWAHLNFPKREWQSDDGAAQYRRGLYTYWCRTFLHPSMKAFDATSREECTVARPRSNTPLQALVLLNDPTYVEASRKLAERALKEGGSTSDERIAFLYQWVLSREPRAEETELLSELAQQHQTEFTADPPAAAALLAVGQSSRDPELDAIELAAWTSVARTLLNLHETITRH